MVMIVVKRQRKTHVWLFSSSERPLKAPEGPQWLALDILVWSEMSRENVLLWDDFIIAFWGGAPIGEKIL